MISWGVSISNAGGFIHSRCILEWEGLQIIILQYIVDKLRKKKNKLCQVSSGFTAMLKATMGREILQHVMGMLEVGNGATRVKVTVKEVVTEDGAQMENLGQL